MILVKLLIYFLIIDRVTCLAEIITKLSNPDHSSVIAKTTAQVLNLCYKKKVNTVGIAGNLDELLIRDLHSYEFSTVSLIGNISKRLSKNDFGRRGLPHKLQIFIIAASSATELEKILKDIKDSIWWNHLASYLILDSTSGLKYRCLNAFQILRSAWKMNLLNAKFVCFNQTNDQWIYSYNPYTKHAPNPWRLIKTYKGIKIHPWSLFVRRYQEIRSICKELDFDRAKNLGGYGIYSSGTNVKVYCTPDSYITHKNCFDMSYKVVKQIISEILGGVFYIKRQRGLSIRNSSRTNNDVLMEVESGIADILWYTRLLPTVLNYTITYPSWRSGLSVMTQQSPEKSSLSKIRSLFDSAARFGFYLVLFITMLFFKWYLRQEVMSVILNTLRIICNFSVDNLPVNVAPRIYFGSLLMFVLVIQAAYQGNLSSLLTMSVPLPNVETIEDLDKFRYTIYGHKSYGRFFKDSNLKERFIGVEDYNCTKYVLRDSSAACIRGERYLIPEMIRFGLHMSGNVIIELYEVYVIRKDWPIEERFNVILSRMSEAGIILYWHSKQTGMSRVKYYFLKNLLLEKKFRVITLNHLAFAFIFLGVGLGYATIVFIIEIGMISN